MIVYLWHFHNKNVLQWKLFLLVHFWCCMFYSKTRQRLSPRGRRYWLFRNWHFDPSLNSNVCGNPLLTINCYLDSLEHSKRKTFLHEKCAWAVKEKNVCFMENQALPLSLANISSSTALIYASTLSFWNPGNSLLTSFSTSTLTPSKLFFTHRIHIGSYQPLPLLKTNGIPRLKILQWFSFVLRIRKQTLIVAYRAWLTLQPHLIYSLLLFLWAPISFAFLQALKGARFPTTHT